MSKGIGRRALTGISWTLLGEIVANLTRIVGVATLGRLLTRADFGVVAVAMTVVLFAARFKELGLGVALVQRKEIDNNHVATTWGFSLLLGVVLAAAVFVAAEPLASAYAMPQAAEPIRALSVLFLIRSLSSTSRALCQRELRFRALATINVAAYICGTATSITLAVSGYGLWSLVVGYIAEASVETVVLVVVRRPRVWPGLHRRGLRDLLGFGSGHTVAAFANYFATQGDNIIVGRFLGDVMLGLYDRAYVLMRFPAQVFTSVAGSVLFSSFSRLQDDPERLGQVFRRVLFANAAMLMPASAGLVVLAPEATRILLGPEWDPVVLPFQIMALSMLFRTSYKASAVIARAAGAVVRIAACQVLYAAAVIGGAVLSMRWGIVGVSVTTTIAVILHFFNLTRLALRHVPLGWGSVLKAHADGLVMASLAVGGSLPTTTTLRAMGFNDALVAIAGTAAGAVLPIGYGLWQIRRGAPDWVWVVDRVRQMVRGKKKRASLTPPTPQA